MIEIHIGGVTLRRDQERWWLLRPSGEGMEVSEAELERILREYLDENF